MDLRRLSLYIAVVVLALLAHCSEARHSIHRREAGEVNYEDQQADEAIDDEGQNDDGGNDADEDAVVVGAIQTKSNEYLGSVGTSLRLECRVTPKDEVVVAWFKDGQQYFLGKTQLKGPHRLFIAPDSTDLQIIDLQSEDTGVYKCEIVQEAPVSILHRVSVTEAPRIIRFSAANDHLTEGQDMLLTCDAVGLPRPEILWSRMTKDGTEKLTEKNGEFSTNTFFARNVTKEMSGRYLCYAINSVNSSQATLVVTIFGKPRVRVHKTIVNSDIGREAVLQCFVHEEPAPFIRWYKDGHLIEDSSTQYSVTTSGLASNLTIQPRVDQDFGTYTCEAENDHGTHNKSIDLVQSPVIEDLHYEDHKITWKVNSHQPLEEMQLLYKSVSPDSQENTIIVPLPTGNGMKHEYEIICVLGDNQLQPDTYTANVRVKNGKSWNIDIEPLLFEFGNQPQPIQTASVFRANDAHSIRTTTTAVLSTVLMYLLVRML